MKTENALELCNVTKKYKDFTLKNLSLRLPQGCVMGLIGENGAGKSTTIKAVTGAVRADEGSISVLGCDVGSGEFQKVKEDVGVVMDEACFPDVLCPRQVNKVMKQIYKNWEENVFFSYLKKFKLPEEKAFKEFSRGMKMKLSIAAALSHRPKLLILDEATSGLDPIVRDEILDVFNEFTRDECHSILISSHIVSDLEKICDYIAFIHEGKLLFCEEKDVLLEEYGLLSIGTKDFEAIDPDAVLSYRNTGYGVEAIVRRSMIPESFHVERAGIEAVMVAMAKEVRS
ncbi:MAG: ABC transporter ATP-binding protein [Eubacteriales bacterium]|nr:ABC transporter ATP-binding protein [Eubacteriales bacterium]